MSMRAATRLSGKITIVRLPKVGNYFVVTNSLFSDESLSWEARGLMGYLLSKPDDWKVWVQDLVAHGPAGRDKIRRMLRELEQAGYLIRRRLVRPNGTFDWETFIFETPAVMAEVMGLPVHSDPTVP